MTSRDYWEGIQFEYMVIYSLLHSEEVKEFMKNIDRKIKILKEGDEINILNELRIKGNIKR